MPRAKPPTAGAEVKAPPRKRTARKPKPAEVDVDLHELGARVLSIFGPYGSRALIEMPTTLAATLFPEPLSQSSRTGLIEAVERDVEELAKVDPALAGSALAATALALALEIENPYNSATSKAMCAGQLRDTLGQLRELAPPAKEKDDLDELTARRSARLASGGAAS